MHVTTPDPSPQSPGPGHHLLVMEIDSLPRCNYFITSFLEVEQKAVTAQYHHMHGLLYRKKKYIVYTNKAFLYPYSEGPAHLGTRGLGTPPL